MSASAIRDIRRNNLRLLIAERFEGVRARFARAVGARDSHVNNIFSRARGASPLRGRRHGQAL